MAVTYLKKKKMYELAVSICPDVPALRNCEYRFDCGAEWFKWHSGEECEDGWIGFELYCCQSYCSFEKVQHFASKLGMCVLSRQDFTTPPRLLLDRKQVLQSA